MTPENPDATPENPAAKPPPKKPFFSRAVIVVLSVLGGLGLFLRASYVRVRDDSRDKTVLCNVRQLSAAADQYFLENGVSTVKITELVGATNYLKANNIIDRETYPVSFTQGITITVTGIAGVRTVTYAP